VNILTELKDKYRKYKEDKGIEPYYLLINPADYKEVLLNLGNINTTEPLHFIDNVLIVPSESIKFGNYCYARK
jgi:hypothetical protein